MALPFILKNFAVHLDGTPKFGEGEKCMLPALKIKTEEYRGGGMDIPVEVDLGMEKLEVKFTLSSFDDQSYTLFGKGPGDKVPLTFRGHLVGENGATRPVVANMRVLIRDIDPVEWETGKKTGIEVTAAVHYFKLTHGEATIVEIDPENGVRMINGVNQLSEMRVNLGF